MLNIAGYTTVLRPEYMCYVKKKTMQNMKYCLVPSCLLCDDDDPTASKHVAVCSL